MKTDLAYKLVPVVPTEAMIDRFVSRALCVSVHGEGGWSNYARGQWSTMLAAAPEPSLTDAGREALAFIRTMALNSAQTVSSMKRVEEVLATIAAALAATPTIAEAPAHKGYPCSERPMTLGEQVMWAEIVKLREALSDIFEHCSCRKQAPGHCHTVPGIWDDDAGNRSVGRAGLSCDWCAKWERARALATPDLNQGRAE